MTANLVVGVEVADRVAAAMQVDKATSWVGVRVLAALLVMSLVILAARAAVQSGAGWSELAATQRALGLAGIILIAIVSYAATLALLGVKPREFRSNAYE